jgi:DNA adenine methylase
VPPESAINHQQSELVADSRSCSSENTSVLPFLKWPGGKRWAAPRIVEIIRECLTGTYYEPFLGGGAVFFHLRPERAVLSDINDDLINTYEIVKSNSDELLAIIKAMPVSSVHYYRIRDSEPSEPLLRAGRLLYLNRTAFGGVYRLNKLGKFNVPYGGDRTPEALWRNKLIKLASVALAHADIRVGDFEFIMNEVGEGDVVYCDPTYTVAHDSNGFRRYNERNFAWLDQERLAHAAVRALRRGATVVVSNAHHQSIKKLYPFGECIELTRYSNVSPNRNARRQVQEYLFVLRAEVG